MLSRPSFISVPVLDSRGVPFTVVPAGDKNQRIRFLEKPFLAERELGDLVEDADLVEEALDEIDADVTDRAASLVERRGFTLVLARNIAHLERLSARLRDRASIR